MGKIGTVDGDECNIDEIIFDLPRRGCLSGIIGRNGRGMEASGTYCEKGCAIVGGGGGTA